MQTRQMPIQRSQPGDDDEYDELDLDDYDDDFSGFELGKRLKAPQAKLYTTKELHRELLPSCMTHTYVYQP